MSAPSQTNLYFINWVKQAALCLLLTFPSVFAPSLFMWMWAFDRKKKKKKKNAKTVGRERKTREKDTHAIALPLLVFNFVVFLLNHEIGFPLEKDVFLRASAIEIALPVTITSRGLCPAVVVDKRGTREGERGRELLVSGGHKTSRVSRCYFLFAR